MGFKRFWDDNLLTPKVLYFTMNLAYYSCYTFRAKYLKEQQQIDTKDYGLIASVLSLVIFAAGFIISYVISLVVFTVSFVADRLQNSKLILIVSALVSGAVFQLFIIPFGDMRMVYATIVSGVYIFFTSAYIPLLDAFVMQMLSTRPGASKEMYGRQRMFGTIGYAAIALAVSAFPLFPTINYLIVVLSIVFALCVYFFVENPAKRPAPLDIEQKAGSSVTLPEKALTTPPQEPAKPAVKAAVVERKGGLKQLLSNPNYLFLLLVVFMNGLARAVMTHFVEPIQRNVYKTPASATGISAASGVALEIVVFFFSKQLLGYFGVRRMLLLSQLAMVLRISCYAFLPRYFPGAQYIPIGTHRLIYILLEAYELFKGLSFGFMQSASVIWVSEITTPDTKVIGQAIYTGIAGFAAGMVGYAVQNIGVENMSSLSKEEVIIVEVEKSILLLELTAYLSIFALVLFFVKYIVIEEWMAKKATKA